MGDSAQRLGYGLRCADSLDHVGVSPHQHHVGLAPDDARAGELRERLEVPAGLVGEHDVIGAAGASRIRLVSMASEHGDGTAGEQSLQRGERRQADDAGAHDQHGFAVARR